MVQEAPLHDEIVEGLRALTTDRQAGEADAALGAMLDRLSNRDVAEALLALSDQELGDLLRRLTNDTLADLLAESVRVVSFQKP